MLASELRDEIRWRIIALTRAIGKTRVARSEWEALSAWTGLVHQAYKSEPLQVNLCSSLWHQGRFQEPSSRSAFFTPSRREREHSSHHYGHDILLKRHLGLPLVGSPLPVLLEHGLKVSRSASFEQPKAWAHQGYICMGPLRAQWLREKFNVSATAIGPWICLAKPLFSDEIIKTQRERWGKTLLVVLAHSWDQVDRSMDLQACIEAVEAITRQENYQQVVWLRHWKDSEKLQLPEGWIKACNGHRSNPWFLDAMRTLLELSDGLASNAFGTHIGYGAALGCQLHWVDVEVEQDLSNLSTNKAQEEEAEWSERQRLIGELRKALTLAGIVQQDAIKKLLDPYWGLNKKPNKNLLSRKLSR